MTNNMTNQAKQLKKKLHKDSLKTVKGRNKARESTKGVLDNFEAEVENIFQNLNTLAKEKYSKEKIDEILKGQ